jgi:hypothetical protein
LHSRRLLWHSFDVYGSQTAHWAHEMFAISIWHIFLQDPQILSRLPATFVRIVEKMRWRFQRRAQQRREKFHHIGYRLISVPLYRQGGPCAW